MRPRRHSRPLGSGWRTGEIGGAPGPSGTSRVSSAPGEPSRAEADLLTQAREAKLIRVFS